MNRAQTLVSPQLAPFRERIAGLDLDYEEAQKLRQAVLDKALAIVYGV